MGVSVDEAYMRMALSLAQDGLGRVWPNPSVGCVLVNDGVPVGYARTADRGRPHAETQAIEAAGERAKGATAYVTLEPCHHEGSTPACSKALIEAGVARVLVACEDPDPRTAGQGIQRLRDAGIDVEVGIFEDLANEINAGFFSRIQRQRPFVCLKQAVSANGMIAAAKGQRSQISGHDAYEYLHDLRSVYDAIAVGIGTVLADDPMLTARIPKHQHSIVRIVFDSSLQIPLDSQLVKTANDQPVWLVYKAADDDKKTALEEAGVVLIDSGACVTSAVQAITERGITRLLVEGGAKLHHSFLEAGLYDEVQMFKSANSLPDDGIKAADFDLDALSLQEMRDLGEDRLEIYRKSA